MTPHPFRAAIGVCLLSSTALAADEAAVVGESVAPADVGESADEPSPLDVLGSADVWALASEGYRLRGAFGDGRQNTGTDQDARFLLAGGARMFDGKVGVDSSMTLFWDIDGPNTDGGFYSVRDDPTSVDFQVQNLEARLEGTRWVRRASVGRLMFDEGPSVTLDGATATVVPFGHIDGDTALGIFRSEVFVAGGRTVHFFEVDDNLYEDWLVAGGANLYFLRSLKLRLDYRAYIEDSAARGVDHSYGTTLFFRWQSYVMTEVYIRGINDQLERVGGRGRAGVPQWDLGLDVFADVQTATLGQVNELANPYYAVLGESQPNARGGVEAFKIQDTSIGGFRIAEFGARGGWMGRTRLFGKDEAFNRSYGRAWAGGDVAELFGTGLFAAAALEYHYAARPTDDGLFAVGGSAGYRSRVAHVELGTDYQRYKYTYYRDVNEIADVRTVYVSTGVRFFEVLRLQGNYSLELFDRTVHTLTLSLSQDFGA